MHAHDRRPIGSGELAALAAVLGGAAALRLYGLGGESAWCDEALTAAHLPAASLRAYLADAFAEDPRLRLSPVYYVLQYAWSAVFGGSLISLRLLSVWLGVAALGALYAWGRAAFDARTGLLAAALGAAALGQVYFAQEVRFYALMGLLACGSQAALAHAQARGRRAAWAAHLACNALLIGTHAFALLFIAGQAAGLALGSGRPRRRLLAWMAAQGAIAAGLAAHAWAIGYDFAGHSEAYAGPPPSLRDLAIGLVILAGGRFSGEGTAAYLPLGMPLDLAFAALVLTAATLPAARACRGLVQDIGTHARRMPGQKPGVPVIPAEAGIQARSPCAVRNTTSSLDSRFRGNDDECGLLRTIGDRTRAASGLLLDAAVPVALLFLAALVWKPCFFPRYVLFAAYPLLLLAARGLATLPPRLARPAAALVLCIGLANTLIAERPLRPGYRAFAGDAMAGPPCHKRVYALKEFNAVAARYALGAYAPVHARTHFDALCDDALDAARSGHEVWAVFHHWARTGDFAARLDAAGLAFEHRRYPGMPPLDAFRIAPAPEPAP